MDGNALLPAVECFAHKGIYLFNLVVGHGEAANALAVAMHHNERAAASKRAVERIGIANVHGQMIIAFGFETFGIDAIEAFRRHVVALNFLGSKCARPGADRVRLDVHEAAAGARFPDFEL